MWGDIIQPMGFPDHVQKDRDNSAKNKEINQTELDRLILTITAGAFAVSISFFTYISAQMILEEVLYVIWILLGATLILQILNYLYAINLAERTIISADETIRAGKHQVLLWALKVGKLNNLQKIVERMNATAACLTITAIVLLILFGIANIAAVKGKQAGMREIEQKYRNENSLETRQGSN
jgi:hypothetical protein